MMKAKAKRMQWLWVGVCVVVISAVSPASYLFYDNFEDVEATAWIDSTTPNVNDDADPSAQIGSWSVNEGSNIWSVQVIDNPANGFPGAVSGDNYLSLNRPASGGFVDVRGNLTETTSNAGLEVSFNAYIPTGEAYPNSQMYFYLYGGTPQNAVDGVRFELLKSGGVYVYQPGGNSSLATAPVDTWVNYRIHDFDFVSNTYSISFGAVDSGSTTTVSDIAFRVAMDDVFQMRFYQGVNGSRAFVDDVYAIPEPATLLLLGAGATVLVRKRRTASA